MTNYRIVWIAGVVFVLAGSALSAQEKAPAAEEMGHGMAHGMPREATPGANSVANQQVSHPAPPQDAAQSSAGATPSSEPTKPVEVRYPDPDIGVDTLAARKKAQLETVGQFKVFHDFQFTDRVQESGITFIQHSVADTRIDMKPSQYDHGNGLAVADVDGDGLYDIYFVNQAGGNELWKNLGGGMFKNITEEAGVGLPGRISVSAAFGDIDNDGSQDLFVTTVRGGNALFKNDGHGHFKDITKEAGLNLLAHSSGAFFFDYDNDGLPDLLVCNVGNYTSDEKGPDGEYRAVDDAFFRYQHPEQYEYPVLYKNMGHSKFKDVTAEVGLTPHGWCGDAGFADLKGDGFPGVFFLNMHGHASYFENQGGKKFVDKTAQYFPQTPWGSMGIKFFDFDNDGLLDLLLTDMHSDMWEEVGPWDEKLKSRGNSSALGGPRHSFIFGNALYHNLGGGKFEEVSDAKGVENYWPWGVSVADINADGWDDVFITSGMGYPFRYGIDSMLLNNRGNKFLDSEFLLGIEPRGQTHAPLFDLDCSQGGLNHGNRVVCAGRTGQITVMSTMSSRGSVIFDIDNDGALDIVIGEWNAAPRVLMSDLAQRRKIHWLKIVLVGTASNRNGLGATVRVHAGGQVYMKYNDGKSGYLAQSVLPLYFGLGDATKVDQVDVDWPSGRKQKVTQGLQANDTLRIVEPNK
jgi:hypothetical protein